MTILLKMSLETFLLKSRFLKLEVDFIFRSIRLGVDYILEYLIGVLRSI